MKSIYATYAVVILGIIVFLGLFGIVLVWGGLGLGVDTYIEATRYMSLPGKVAYISLTVSVFVFLIKFATTQGK